MVNAPPLASGRDADVYAIDEHRVLRRYRNGGDVAGEAAVMAHVAAHDFPTPRVHEAHGPDLVLERLYGPTMLAAVLSGDLSTTRAAAILADLHRRLHALPLRLGADPTASILHLDLHPANVILSSRGPVVIDWRNSAEGPPGLDVAMSAVILAQVAVDDGNPMAEAAQRLLTAFLRVTPGDPMCLLDDAVAIRKLDPAFTAGEVEQLPAAAALARRCCR